MLAKTAAGRGARALQKVGGTRTGVSLAVPAVTSEKVRLISMSAEATASVAARTSAKVFIFKGLEGAKEEGLSAMLETG